MMRVKLMRRVMISLALMAGMLQAQELLDGVVAIVGEHIVLRSEVLQQAQIMASQQHRTLDAATIQLLSKRVLSDLINQKVMLIKAKEDTITVEDQQVEQALEQRIQGAVERYGSVEKVEEYFGIPINKIKRNYRADMKNSMIVQQVQNKQLAGLSVTRAEVESFYAAMKDSLPQRDAMVRLRHILLTIKPGGSAYDKGMVKMREVQRKLTEGATLESLAPEYSEDPGTANRGGDLGWIEHGLFDETFEETAFQLEPGETSDVIQTSVGLHILKVVDKEDLRVRVHHIFVRLTASQDDDVATLNRMNDLHKRLLAGAAFDSLALAYSDDMTTNLQGGDLGWLPKKQLQIEAFRAVVDTLGVGHFTPPFKTQFGYHLVLKEDEKPARPITLAEDYEELKNYAKSRKSQRKLKEWIADLKKQIYIETHEELLD